VAPLTHGSIRQDVKERYQVMLSHLLQERSSVHDGRSLSTRLPCTAEELEPWIMHRIVGKNERSCDSDVCVRCEKAVQPVVPPLNESEAIAINSFGRRLASQ
jgi:hypothetical protein